MARSAKRKGWHLPNGRVVLLGAVRDKVQKEGLQQVLPGGQEEGGTGHGSVFGRGHPIAAQKPPGGEGLVHEKRPGGLGVGGLGEVLFGGVVKEGGVVAARQLGEELAPGEGVLLREVRHLEEGGLGVEEEEPVPEAVQVVLYGLLGKAPLLPPVQDVLRAAGAQEGPVQDGEEQAVEGGLLQGGRGFYAGELAGLQEGLPDPHLHHPPVLQDGDPGLVNEVELPQASHLPLPSG